MSTQHHIEVLKKRLRKIRTRRAMLEASAPPDRRDRELRSRIAETEAQESVALERLAILGACPEVHEPAYQ